jgi:hypothetical protein
MKALLWAQTNSKITVKNNSKNSKNNSKNYS